MKQRRVVIRHKNEGRDYGKNLFDTIIVLLILLAILWYLKI
jgi:hypothetical protein